MHAVLLLASGTDPEHGRRHDPPPTDGAPPETASTAETAAPVDTGPVEPEPAFDCSAPPPAGPFQVDAYDIWTTEDFDFDALGGLVYVSVGIDLVAADVDGNVQIVSPGVYESRGVQVLSTGDVLTAYVSQGRLGWTDRATGANVAWATGLVQPNALEIGDGDVVYVGELGGGVAETGRVLRYDPATQALDVIAEGFDYPNGLALNEEQDRLYVADNNEGIYVLREDAAGVWGPPERLFQRAPDDLYDAIEVDLCGRVYVLNYRSGEVTRFDPETGERVLIVTLDDVPGVPGESWSSMRWGSDRGGWRRDTLYATDRNRVFGVRIGVPGRSQPIDALP